MDAYEEWVIEEYNLWKIALLELCADESKFSNFKSLPQVQRMVGVPDGSIFFEKLRGLDLDWQEIIKIDKIGYIDSEDISSITLRYVYYANKILNIIKDYKYIRLLEIGAGFGGLCAMFHILAKQRGIKIEEYSIYDLPEVQMFQRIYLEKTLDKSSVQKLSFLDSNNLEGFDNQYNYCISFYALGEFSTMVKNKYIEHVVSKIEHGFIIWNPHNDNPDKDISVLRKYHPLLKVSAENPITSVNNLEIRF